jgi:hypothetical protein
MTDPRPPEARPEPFDLHAVQTRLGLARFGAKDRDLHVRHLIDHDIPRLITFAYELSGAIIAAGQRRAEAELAGDRSLGLLVGTVAQLGGEVRLTYEQLNNAGRGWSLGMQNDGEGITLRLEKPDAEASPAAAVEAAPDPAAPVKARRKRTPAP